jgi:hypothetical protein
MSIRRPFVVEIQPPRTKSWFAVGYYRDQEEAEMQAELMRKWNALAPIQLQAKVHVIDRRV